MPFETLKIVPNVNLEHTPSDVQAGLVASSFIRWRDSIPEKRGGWSYFYNGQVSGIPRELHAWQGLNVDKRLAIGTTAQLDVLYQGSLKDITAQTVAASITCDLTTTMGSTLVEVHDPGRDATIYNTVVFNTQASIGGITLFGAYQIVETAGTDDYYINAAMPATSAVSNAGAVATFTTTNGQSQITVTLDNHPYVIGEEVAFPVSTSGAGVTIFGQYLVTSVPSADTFTINANTSATASTTFSMNGGNLSLLYYIALGPTISGSGYGVGAYGAGGYGTGQTPPSGGGTEITATDYWLDNWGEILVSCPAGGPIFTWSSDNGYSNVAIIPQAPLTNAGMFVAMPQQQIMAWGSTNTGISDPLLIKWCDVSDYTDWTAAVTNQAGSYRIPTGSQIVRGLQGPNQTYWFTDIDLYVAQYIGQPFVWGFNKIATGCGLIAPKAVIQLGSMILWMSQKQFFMTSAGAPVQPIPCSVWDFVFQNLNTAYVSNIRAGANSQFNEAVWYFPSKASTSGENDSYVSYNSLYQEWDCGAINRSSWIDQSVLGPPIGTDSSGYIYQHETSNDAAGQAMSTSFSTGYFSISNGEDFAFVDWAIPDMRWGQYGASQTAVLSVTFNVTDYPGDTPVAYGPFSISQGVEYIEPRFRGRYMQIMISGNDVGSFWRLGSFRYRWAKDGRR